MDRPLFCVVAQGAKQVLLSDGWDRYDPGTCLMISIDMPLVGEVVRASPAEPCLSVSLALDIDELTALALEVELADRGPAGADAEPAAGDDGGRPTAGARVHALDAPLLDALTRLVALLRTPVDLPLFAPLARREVRHRLLLGEHGALLRQLAAARGPARRIAAGLAWLCERAAAPVRMADLAREVHMSESAMYAWFKAVAGLSPLQYQKRLRLQEARRLMLVDALDVAGAGARVGYASASHFSR